MALAVYCITAVGFIGLAVFLMRRDAVNIAKKDLHIEYRDGILSTIEKAKNAHDRLNYDSDYLARVRDRFTRK